MILLWIAAGVAGLVALLEAKGCGAEVSVPVLVALVLAYAYTVRALDARALREDLETDPAIRVGEIR